MKLSDLIEKNLTLQVFFNVFFFFLFILDNVQDGSHGWEGYYRTSYPP
jgi:hypothetical protein